MTDQATNTATKPKISTELTIVLAVIAAIVIYFLGGSTYDSVLSQLGIEVPHDSVTVAHEDTIRIGKLQVTIQAQREYIDSLELANDSLANRPPLPGDTVREKYHDPDILVEKDRLRFELNRARDSLRKLGVHEILYGSTIAQRQVSIIGTADTFRTVINDSLFVRTNATTGEISIESSPEIIVRRYIETIDCGEAWWVKPVIGLVAAAITFFLKPQ